MLPGPRRVRAWNDATDASSSLPLPPPPSNFQLEIPRFKIEFWNLKIFHYKLNVAVALLLPPPDARQTADDGAHLHIAFKYSNITFRLCVFFYYFFYYYYFHQPFIIIWEDEEGADGGREARGREGLLHHQDITSCLPIAIILCIDGIMNILRFEPGSACFAFKAFDHFAKSNYWN